MKEELLFTEICNFKDDSFDEDLLKYATPKVLGMLFFNRMQAIAYGNMKEKNILENTNREFRNSLKMAYQYNTVKNKSFYKCINDLGVILDKSSCEYAMLKGAVLCGLYPEGYRTSNDIDLLIHPKDITRISNLLKMDGFRQGSIKNDVFAPAHRREIIDSKMMRGETVPFVKEVNLPNMKYMEVDINFSLDYKNGDTEMISEMLKRTERIEILGVSVQTLASTDFFIHLCAHLYKEATTLPWIEMKRDMTLYKFCDLYFLLYDIDDKKSDELFRRAEDLGLDKICAYAIIVTYEMFEIKSEHLLVKSRKVLENDKEFMRRVYSPKEKTSYMYMEDSVFKRFFADDRKAMLRRE